MAAGSASSQRLAWRFVVGLGLVSLFADFTYEGGRSVLGSYLAVLGASPLVVGVVAGVGEFLGYGLRLVSGRSVDQRGRPWALMFPGYALNLLAFPAMALISALAPVAGLAFAERLGKGLRTPARDALLAAASDGLGRGSAFGLHEALDQVGALLGPLVVAAAVAWSGYRAAFGVLLVPAVVALVLLGRARGLEPARSWPAAHRASRGLSPAYWRFLTVVAVVMAGFAHFALVAYRLQAQHVVAPAVIPLLFALAMGIDAGAALAAGRAYDRLGVRVLYAFPLLSVPIAPLVFLTGGVWTLALGMALWGAAFGMLESLTGAVVADVVATDVRGTAYGVLYAVMGGAWLLGSVSMGWLYGISPGRLVVYAVTMQVAAGWAVHRLVTGGGAR